MLKWFASEFHAHTVHSDGKFTLIELCDSARDMGLDAVALTDHNTISAHPEISNAEKQTGIHIIPGMELTTFYGHIVAMGIREYIDWRDIGIDDVHKQIARIHAAKGLAGVAHPFIFGSPICTGCHFDYEISDWNHVDYIEVWRGEWPSLTYFNKAAFSLWTKKLNEGFNIYGVSARDWHSNTEENKSIAVTYVGIEDDSTSNFFEGWMEGVRNGRLCVAIGPFLVMEVQDMMSLQTYRVGDIINSNCVSDEVKIKMLIDFERRKHIYKLDHKPLRLYITGNDGKVYEKVIEKFNIKNTLEFTTNISLKGLKWLRCELFGSMNDIEQTIAFTNPIFIY